MGPDQRDGNRPTRALGHTSGTLVPNGLALRLRRFSGSVLSKFGDRADVLGLRRTARPLGARCQQAFRLVAFGWGAHSRRRVSRNSGRSSLGQVQGQSSWVSGSAFDKILVRGRKDSWRRRTLPLAIFYAATALLLLPFPAYERGKSSAEQDVRVYESEIAAGKRNCHSIDGPAGEIGKCPMVIAQTAARIGFLDGKNVHVVPAEGIRIRWRLPVHAPGAAATPGSDRH